MKREVLLSRWRVELSLNVVNPNSASVSARFTSTDNAVKHRHSIVMNFLNDNEKARTVYENFDSLPIINQIIAI